MNRNITLQELLPRYVPVLQHCREIMERRIQGAGVLAASRPLIGKGKLLRPILALAACEAVGGDPYQAVPAAVAVEMMHTASLIHDDIIDASDLRRGVPTVHRQVGVNRALICGDALLLQAFREVAAAATPDGLGRAVSAISCLAEQAIHLCDGQEVDILQTIATEADYYDLVRRKTAPLLAAAVKMGAILGGGMPQQVAALERYAEQTGIAFQIQDDLLDLTATADQLGKPVGETLTAGKRTLPVLHMLASLPPGLREAVEEQFRRRAPADVDNLSTLVKEYGSLDYTQQQAQEFVRSAVAALEALPPSAARETLEAIAVCAVNRSN